MTFTSASAREHALGDLVTACLCLAAFTRRIVHILSSDPCLSASTPGVPGETKAADTVAAAIR